MSSMRRCLRFAAKTQLRLIGAMLTVGISPSWAQYEPAAAPAAAPKPTPASASAPASATGTASSWASEPWFDGFDAGFGNWSGALGLNFLDGAQSFSSDSAPSSTSSRRTTRETLRIENSGFYILSPLFCTGNMALDLGLGQDKTGGSGGDTATNDSTRGYSLDTTFLPEKPYTASLFANRTYDHLLQPFGGMMVGESQSSGAWFHLRQDSILNDWGYPWIEASLGVHQDHRQNTTTNFGRSQNTDDRNRTIEFTTNKGFETADLGFNYSTDDVSNQEFSQGNFHSKASGLQYSLDFGPTLNRRLDAALSYRTRDGQASSTTVSNSEHLRLDHYQNLSTDYQYGATRQTYRDVRTSQQSGAFALVHRLYDNLTSSAGLSATSATLPNGTITSRGGNLTEAYQHSLPGKGTVFANLSGGYQVNNNDLSASGVNVFDEAHSAPNPLAAGAGFLLDHAFVNVSSIVVTNVRGGARIPTIVDVDYSIVAENNQIRIVPIVGSVLIGAGDPLLVTYTYLLDSRLKYATKSSAFGIGVNYPWILVAYSHQQSEQTPISGTNLFLQNSREDIFQVGLEGTVREMPAKANMSLERIDATTSAYRRTKLTTSLSRELPSNIRLAFGANASESKYTVPDQRTTSTQSARASFNWFTWSGWTHTASLDWSRYRDGSTPAETLVQAIGQSSVTLGKLSLAAEVALGEWLRNGSRSTNRSLNINIVRRF
jgi:hypothetical protein